jgi:hypothetical protein
VTVFKYLRTTVTNRNCVHSGIKNILKLGTACYHSAQSVSCSCLQCISIDWSIWNHNFAHIFYGYETDVNSWRKEHIQDVWEQVLRSACALEREKVVGDLGKLQFVEELHNGPSSPHTGNCLLAYGPELHSKQCTTGCVENTEFCLWMADNFWDNVHELQEVKIMLPHYMCT